MAQARALGEAAQRSQRRRLALQAQVIRLAVHGDADAYGRMIDVLSGVQPKVIEDAEALAAALRWEHGERPWSPDTDHGEG